MLKLSIPYTEIYNEETGTFCYVKEQVLSLEHSLVSISKWESKWQKPFLRKESMTEKETIDYIRCMTITQNVDPMVYTALTPEHFRLVSEYLNAPMSATTFKKEDDRINREIITSERIYYWMITLGIPVEFQKWHLNRLLTLIKVCNLENNPKKMKNRDIINQNRALNEARKKSRGTKG